MSAAGRRSARSPRSSCSSAGARIRCCRCACSATAQFSGTNATTLAVYGALGGALFLVVLELQVALGYSALEAGASLVPMTLLMFLLSPRSGALAQRIGAAAPDDRSGR